MIFFTIQIEFQSFQMADLLATVSFQVNTIFLRRIGQCSLGVNTLLVGQVHVLPMAVSLEQGALCEPLSCILHGWHRLQVGGYVQAQSKILVLGAGIIGIVHKG